jgi:hypothetical protein
MYRFLTERFRCLLLQELSAFLALHSPFAILPGKRACDMDRKIAPREYASPLFSWLNGGLGRWGVNVAFNERPPGPRFLSLAHRRGGASASELSTQRGTPITES